MIGGAVPGRWRQCNAVSPVVTATQTGTGTHNGMALTVKVLNNALITITGPQYQSSFAVGAISAKDIGEPGSGPGRCRPGRLRAGPTGGGGSATVTISPGYTGSWVYGAVNLTGAAVSWSPLTGTTFSENVADSTDSASYGTFRSTGTCTSGTPVTFGGTSALPGNGGVALAEIPPSGTLAEDASSPAAVATSSSTAVSTARFTPPMGALLVAMAATAGANIGLTVADDNGMLPWTQITHWAGGAGYAGVWAAVVVCG